MIEFRNMNGRIEYRTWKLSIGKYGGVSSETSTPSWTKWLPMPSGNRDPDSSGKELPAGEISLASFGQADDALFLINNKGGNA